MSTRSLVIAYRGNHQFDLPPGVVPWSTEHHVAGSIEELGHKCIRISEASTSWPNTVAAAAMGGADMFLWTQTYGHAVSWPREHAVEALEILADRMPTAGLHLDLWCGLDREHQIREEPFFQQLGTVFTADGDHDDVFAAAGVNHRWLPPGVYGPECTPGMDLRVWRADVAFVGSWRGGYHDEWWPHRKAMLDALRSSYRGRMRFWPRRQAIRGHDLNDLYASTKVIVGDSCFADRSTRYFSDRAFETVGRGGFLVMPYISGLAELLENGVHCLFFPPGDHAEMRRVIDYYLAHDAERETIRAAGQAHVRENHTYAHRVQTLLEEVGL